ncbi:hypothetical protein D9M73_149360 [compost metagenome]
MRIDHGRPERTAAQRRDRAGRTPFEIGRIGPEHIGPIEVGADTADVDNRTIAADEGARIQDGVRSPRPGDTRGNDPRPQPNIAAIDHIAGAQLRSTR